MISLRNKKAESEHEMFETVIFLVITVALFAICFYYVSWVGSNDKTIEEQSAKQIALTIDSIVPGSQVVLDLPELFDAAKKNNFVGPEDRVVLPVENGKITVKTSKKTSYSFYTFSSIPTQITIDKITKKIIINA